MKKIIAVFISALFLMSFSSCDNSEKIKFKDKIVESVIREELDKKYSSITRDELLEITYLNFPSIDDDEVQIATLEDLLLCENLERLNLMSSGISDISVLGELENLTTLKINMNNISDISALKGLTKLETLDISYNPITDISVLENFPKLKYLNVNGMENLTDFSPIGKLSRLRDVFLVNNKNLTDISFLSKLTLLEDLNITGCEVSDLSPLKELNYLNSLDVNAENVSDWTAVSHIEFVSGRPDGLYVESDFDPAIYDDSTKITLEEVQKELKVNGETFSYPITLKSLGKDYEYKEEYGVIYQDKYMINAGFDDVGYDEVPDENSLVNMMIFNKNSEYIEKETGYSEAYFDFRGVNADSTEEEIVEKLGTPNYFRGEYDSIRNYNYYIDGNEKMTITFLIREDGTIILAGFTFM